MKSEKRHISIHYSPFTFHLGYLEPIRKVDKYLSEVRLWRKRYTVLREIFKLMNII